MCVYLSWTNKDIIKLEFWEFSQTQPVGILFYFALQDVD
jgi:hypothetical protein